MRRSRIRQPVWRFIARLELRDVSLHSHSPNGDVNTTTQASTIKEAENGSPGHRNYAVGGNHLNAGQASRDVQMVLPVIHSQVDHISVHLDGYDVPSRFPERLTVLPCELKCTCQRPVPLRLI